jgi:acyl-homoserine-lactone acylase
MNRIHLFSAVLCLVLPALLTAQAFNKAEIARWEKQAKQITIIRDHWGIPHIYGKTDADAVFGLLYAQCEDDFKRVEMNYIEKLGRMAEVKGASELYEDLLIRLVIDSSEAVADYKKAPRWLKTLLNAYADGINYYLFKHPDIKPALLTRFKPWYPLLWTDGSIGAINTDNISTEELQHFYTGGNESTGAVAPKPRSEAEILTGSNGFAFGPSVTESGKAILYINPHVTFYFRPEVHVVSEEGLNTYGAVTWGQFFIYQGFNEHCGWMHTSNYTDISDLYIEKISKRNGRLFYTYNGQEKPVRVKKITLRYRENGQMMAKTIDALFTHHGPIMAKREGKWLSMKANNRSMIGLIQSWQRTKARGFEDYKKVMELRSNTSNNTVYADKSGNIAYWHGNFMPIRDTKIDWTKPVDGSTTATEWKGLHPVRETVHLYNPPNGWIQNCNSTPYTAAAENSPKKSAYPVYMAPDGENFRGLNAVRVLQREKKYTLDKVIAAGYDTYMVAFELLVPALLEAYDKRNKAAASSALDAPIAVLKSWDFRSSEQSVATTLAIEWGTRLLPAIQQTVIANDFELDQVAKTKQFVATALATAPERLLEPFAATVTDLQQKFGTWQVSWGEINRFQRISSDIEQPYNDAAPSLPVAYASSVWGTLPSYTARYFPGTKKRYGVNGNSFICAVEFGDRVKAKSLLAGGQNGDPISKHFRDQAEMYAKGKFKDVLFYKEDILKHAERTYQPGL